MGKINKEIQLVTLDLTADVVRANIVLEDVMNDKINNDIMGGSKTQRVRNAIANLINSENILNKFNSFTTPTPLPVEDNNIETNTEEDVEE